MKKIAHFSASPCIWYADHSYDLPMFHSLLHLSFCQKRILHAFTPRANDSNPIDNRHVFTPWDIGRIPLYNTKLSRYPKSYIRKSSLKKCFVCLLFISSLPGIKSWKLSISNLLSVYSSIYQKLSQWSEENDHVWITSLRSAHGMRTVL